MSPEPVVLFDGVCNLCTAAVRFIIARDPAGVFAFAPLQSAAARHLVDQMPAAGAPPDSVVLCDGGRIYARSAAALRIARRLRFPWSLLFVLVVVPRPLRDWVYDLVARHRYRWFGRRDQCMVPTPEMRGRFLS